MADNIKTRTAVCCPTAQTEHRTQTDRDQDKVGSIIDYPLTAKDSIDRPPGQEAQVHRSATRLTHGASGAGDGPGGVQHLAEAFFLSQTAVLCHLSSVEQ